MRKAKNIDLTTGPIWKKLLLYFFPILASSAFQQLYTVVDAMILGRFAGKAGLAAIDSVASLLKFPINFSLGFSAGAAILVSQFFGAKDGPSLSKTVHSGLVLGLIGGALLSLAGVLLAPISLRMLSVPEEIFDLTLSYLRIYFGGMALSLLFNLGAGILRAMGNSKTPFYALLAAGSCNILLDLLFVAGFNMNAAGAALATVLSQGVSAGLILRALLKAKGPERIEPRRLKITPSVLRLIVGVGLPIGLQSALFPVANMIVQSGINRTGTDNIAAWALCGKLDFLIWMISDSLGSAVSTFVAQNHGAKRPHRAQRGVRLGLALTAGLILLVSALLYWGSEALGGLFMPAEDQGIVSLAAKIMRMIAPFYVLYALGEVLSGAIRGTGNSFQPMIITLLSTCAVRVFWMLLIVPVHSAFFTILACYPVSWAITALAFMLYCIRCQKKAFLPSPDPK